DLHLPGRMADTLILPVGGVDWGRLSQCTRSRKARGSHIDSKGAWWYRKVSERYTPQAPRVRLRGLNISRQGDGSVFINGFLLFDVDLFDGSSIESGLAEARAEAPLNVEFLRSHLPGFEKAMWLDDVSHLYFRESRYIRAEYQLKLSDVLENRDFSDAVAVGSYPVDHQSYSPHDPGIIYGRPNAYAVSIRSLIPLNIDNMLVVGRCAGCTSLAAGSARTIPLGMAEGEAAAMAAYFSIRHDVGFRELARSPDMISELQMALVSRGLVIHPPKPYPSPFADNPYRQQLLEALDLGLIDGGYDNNFHLDKLSSVEQITQVWHEAYRRRFGKPPPQLAAEWPKDWPSSLPKWRVIRAIMPMLRLEN
ncbi:MAG: FAD-dependent oxidoreductase, partial [bacterium]